MAPCAIHATAVAIAGEALLICGPSRSGKSRLAVALIARATRARPVELIGDDRILLSERDGKLVAQPHPRIAGFIERRGLGIVAMGWVVVAPVGGVIEFCAVRDLPPPLAREGARMADEGAGQREPFLCALPHPPATPAPSPARGEEALRTIPYLSLASGAADVDRVLAWWVSRDASATPLC